MKKKLNLEKKDEYFGVPSVFKLSKGRKKIFKKCVLIGIFLLGFTFWAMDTVNVNWRPIFKNNPSMLRVYAPSIVEKGESVEFTVECWDYCERLACGYAGTVDFEAKREKPGTDGKLIDANVKFSEKSYKFIPSWSSQGMIEAYRFPWGDRGFKKFTVKFTEPGIHYIVVEDKELNVRAYSNPILVTEEEPEYYLFWGDIHGHTSKCDGSGDLNNVLYYARNIACLDFAAITTHDHFINALVSPLGWKISWEHTKEVIETWNKKDNFVTMQAYEWRGNFLKNSDPQGDRIIYSRTSEIPYYSGADKRYANEGLLNDALKDWMEKKDNRKVMTIPHHPPHSLIGMRTDWSYIDPEITRLVEIYSVHGSSEMSVDDGNEYPLMGGNKKPKIMEIDDPGYHVRDALAMGYHLGLMASGDSHDGHIGHSISHTEARHLFQPPFSWSAYANHMFRCHHWQQNGLIGVFAPKLSRSAIFDAIWERACYGIKGTSRPYINFTINGTMVGEKDSIIEVPNKNSHRLIKLDVAAGGGDFNFLKKIQIIKNNEVWKEINLRGEKKRIYHGIWHDNDTIKGISYWNYSRVDPDDYKKNNKYYINDEADNGVKNIDDYSTKGQDFYYIKVYSEGSRYYDNIFDYYNTELVPRGDDVAWIGPIWIKTTG
ncbi:MAG: DUF3604 domain-containing protein [Promethearchaeota archaeon]